MSKPCDKCGMPDGAELTHSCSLYIIDPSAQTRPPFNLPFLGPPYPSAQISTRLSEQQIYAKAVMRWGTQTQWRMVQEECAELIAEINRFDRHRSSDDALAEEVADVMIMMGQAAIMVGEGLVERHKQAKLDRLRQKLEARKDEP